MTLRKKRADQTCYVTHQLYNVSKSFNYPELHLVTGQKDGLPLLPRAIRDKHRES